MALVPKNCCMRLFFIVFPLLTASFSFSQSEKCGFTSGEAMNAKAGTIGDFANNLCIGITTNGPKLSNAGAITGVPGSNVRMYNNTIINCGYRRSAAGRGGSILPAGWKLGDTYTAPASFIGANNPQFINGPVSLPAGYNLRDVVVAGYTGFLPRGDVPVDPVYGVTELTLPGKDQTIQATSAEG